MSARRPRALVAATAAATWLTLCSCADGYSSQDETLHLAFGMSQEATLTAMNQIGQSKQVQTRARYALLDGCVMEVRARRQFDGKDSQAIPLPGTEAALEKQADGKTYRVKLNSADPGGPTHTALDSAPWAEATQMKWLLDYARSFC